MKSVLDKQSDALYNVSLENRSIAFALLIKQAIELNESGDIDINEIQDVILKADYFGIGDAPEMKYVAELAHDIDEYEPTQYKQKVLAQMKILTTNYLAGKREPTYFILKAGYYLYNEVGEAMQSVGVQIRILNNVLIIESGDPYIKSQIEKRLSNSLNMSKNELDLLQEIADLMPKIIGKYSLDGICFEELLENIAKIEKD